MLNIYFQNLRRGRLLTHVEYLLSEPEERKRLGTDPMFKLQYQTKDEAVVEEAEPIIDKLQVPLFYGIRLKLLGCQS